MFEHDEDRYRVFQTRPQQRSGLKALRAGFTLVELLVVITIIGILMGLTLPAVMSAIESARRISCANNMRQVALALNTYETTQKQYPLNWGVVSTVGVPTNGTQGAAVGVSWMAAILPNIDQTPLYNTILLGAAVGYQDSNGYSNLQALATPINTYLCPSDTQRGTIGNQALGSGTFGTTNYKACAGSNWPGSGSLPAVTWNVGRNNGSSDGVDHGNGVICRGGATTPGGAPIMTSNMDIRDGATKTFLVGEAVPAWCAWSLWFWFDGSTATCGIPLNYTVPNIKPDLNFNDWADTYSFMSRHRGGANFAMCDNSGCFIANLIDTNLYHALATIDGNEGTVMAADGTGTILPVAVPQ